MGRGVRRLTGEVARSATTGTASSLVAIALFNWLVHWDLGSGAGAWLHDRPIVAFLLANGVSTLLTYVMSRWWAFRHRVPSGPLGGVPTFSAISLGSLVIPVACLWVSRDLLGLSSAVSDNVAANGIGLVLGFLARFALFRTLVFPQREDAEPERRLEPQPEA